jgi:hypothetical protein
MEGTGLASSWRRSVPLVLLAWAAARVLFFEGLWGFDDLQHLNYALHFNHLPQNHWETRLIYNASLFACIRTLGYSEWVFALPGLCGSLLFTFATWWAARGVAGERPALVAGLCAAFLPLDVTLSTNPSATALANGFAAAGTALVLCGREGGSWRWALSGALLGISALVHPVMLYYGLILVAAVGIAEWPRLDFRRAVLVGGALVATFAVCELTTYWLLTGHPLYEFEVVSRTHLQNQEFAIPLRLSSGRINPWWLAWPFQNLLFSKAFGFTVSIALACCVLAWRRLPRTMRIAGATLIGYWIWACFGSQHPLRYLPIDHDTRYWYPLALPCCVFAAWLVGSPGSTRVRAGLIGILFVPLFVALLSSGSWGQNVEVSRDLLHYADGHAATFFVTDRYTYDEMYILRGGSPPRNVGLLSGTTASFTAPSATQYVPKDAPGLLVLYNPLQEWRQGFADFGRAVAGLPRCALSGGRYRAIAYALPYPLRSQWSYLVRRPPAELLGVRGSCRPLTQ